MEYSVLDISVDPWEQGFEDRQYDLILATNVVHATHSLQTSLRASARCFIRMADSCCTRFTPLPSGSITSSAHYQVGGTVRQTAEPMNHYVTPERWGMEMAAAGFQDLDTVVLDSQEPFQLNAIMVAKPQAAKIPAKHVTLLHDGETTSVGPLSKQLERRGYTVRLSTFDEIPLPSGQDVIGLLDKDRPFFETMDHARFEKFKALLHNLGGAGLLWVTHPCQVQCKTRDMLR